MSVEGDIARIEYEALSEGSGYVQPIVVLEFGARSTGEPSERRSVTCDAAPHLPEISFPEASPRVMRPERTFWEKATAIHVYCRGGRFRGTERFSRHWYDLDSLSHTPFFESAIADREIALCVARHKKIFFREKDARGEIIDYEEAVRGGLQLVPEGDAEAALAEDYAGMVADGLVFENAPDFGTLVTRCREIQDRANRGS